MDRITVETVIVEAEVYRRGCTITRRGTVELPAGSSCLVIESLPVDLDEESVALRMPAVATQSQVRIVRDEWQQGRDDDDSPLKEISEQIDDLDRKIENLGLELDAWKTLATKMGGTAAIDYLDRLPAKLDELSGTLARLNAERRALSARRDRMRTELMRPRLEVEVRAAEAATLPLELRYRCERAGWKPSFDVMVDKLHEPLRLRMKGVVWQQTGDDWKDVTLRLSTGTAAIMGDLPRFVPRYLARVEPRPLEKASGLPRPMFGRASADFRPGAFADLEESSLSLPMAANAAWGSGDTDVVLPPEAGVQEQAIATTYELAGPQTLVSDAGEQTFSVTTTELAASYHLYAYPRRDQAAYLVAHLDAEPAPEVLENPVSVYLEGSYVGSIRLGQSTDETGYELPLGRDDRVRVTRTEDVERSKRLLGSKVSREHRCRIVVESRLRDAMEIVVIEQVPVSRDTEIEVTLREGSGAAFDKERGELRWERTLGSDERLALTATYAVAHAKGLLVGEGVRASSTLAARTFCPHCGATLAAGDRFCPSCGSVLH